MAQDKRKEKIKRKVRRVRNNGQRALFLRCEPPGQRGGADAEDAKDAEPAEDAESVKRFCDPSPERIQVGDELLPEYLERSGEGQVFQIREILRGMDWSEFEARYSGTGRPPYAPALMAGITLYGIMQGKDSLRALENTARFDSRCWWLTGGASPDHSALGRWINLHDESLRESFFEELTRKILKATGSGGKQAAGDATVTQASASAYKRVKLEAAEQAAAEARREADQKPDEPKAQKAAEQSEQVAEEAKRRGRERQRRGRKGEPAISPGEPEAVQQPLKNGAKEFSYKPSALVNEKRIILAHHVEPSSEPAAVAPMLKQAERASGEKVEDGLWDGGYHSFEPVTACDKNGTRMLCPAPKPASCGVFPKEAFCHTLTTWADSFLCPQGNHLNPIGSGTDRDRSYVLYGTKECTDCKIRQMCTTSPQGRRIKRYEGDGLKERIRERMREPENLQLYSKRQAWVEPVFGEIKSVQRLSRFRRRGLGKVRLEFALHACAHNLRRLHALTAGGRALEDVFRCAKCLLQGLFASASPLPASRNVFQFAI